jgi:hypothetical protein
MSSDTSIWVWKFKDWYRCTWVVQCIDNIDWYREKWITEEYIDEVRSFFWDSEVFKTLELAMDKAMDIERKFEEDDDWGFWLEYWIVKYEFDFNLIKR